MTDASTFGLAPPPDEAARLGLKKGTPDGKPRASAAEASGDGGPGGSTIGALFRGFLHGIGSAGVEAGKMGASIAADLPTQFGRLSQLGGRPDVLGRQALLQRIAAFQQQRQQQHAQQPYVQAHPTAAAIGNVAGQIAPTLALPGGALMRGATLPAKIGGGAIAGALGASTAPTEGADFWGEKAAQLVTGAAAGGVLGGAVGALAPRGAAAVMAQKGVPLTAGMRAGMRSLESSLKAFPVLGTAIRRGEMRTLDGFNRATVDQALEPIGASVPRNMKAGHELIDFGEKQLSDAYDKVLPKISFSETGWQKLKPKITAIVHDLPDDQARLVQRFVNNRFVSRFSGGMMDGREFKAAESQLSNKAMLYGRNTQNAETGDALNQITALLRESLVDQNPAEAPALKNINYGWAMLKRIQQAASSGATSEGKFTPQQLLVATRRQASPGMFSKGDALMQTFAEAADKALGKIAKPGETVPSGGLAAITHLLTIGGGGGAVLGGAEGAGIGSAAAIGAPVVAYGGLKAASAIGRAPGAAVGRTAGLAGRAAAPEAAKVADRMKAARKVGQISTELYQAKRRGDLSEVKSLTEKLSEAQGDYAKMRPAP